MYIYINLFILEEYYLMGRRNRGRQGGWSPPKFKVWGTEVLKSPPKFFNSFLLILMLQCYLCALTKRYSWPHRY